MPIVEDFIDPMFSSINHYGVTYDAAYFNPYPSNQSLHSQPHPYETQSHLHSDPYSPSQFMHSTLPSSPTTTTFVTPQDLHLAYQHMQPHTYLNPIPDMSFALSEDFSMAPTYEPVKVQPTQNHHEQTFLLSEELRPIHSSLNSVDTPKRKGDRALARLHRSVR
jgi:hypothetical protein